MQAATWCMLQYKQVTIHSYAWPIEKIKRATNLMRWTHMMHLDGSTYMNVHVKRLYNEQRRRTLKNMRLYDAPRHICTSPMSLAPTRYTIQFGLVWFVLFNDTWSQ